MIQTWPDQVYLKALKGYYKTRAGNNDAAISTIQKLKNLQGRGAYISPYCFALLHAALGESEEAVQELRRALREGDVRLCFLKVSPLWNLVRAHPQFIKLCTELHI